jgi:hypothetical protein
MGRDQGTRADLTWLGIEAQPAGLGQASAPAETYRERSLRVDRAQRCEIVLAFSEGSPEALEADRLLARIAAASADDLEGIAAADAAFADLVRRASIKRNGALRAETGDSGDGTETRPKPGKREVSSPAPWRPFPVHVLPEPVRAYVRNGAATLGCDPSFVALPLLAGLASAIGNSFRVALKRGWTEPAILWTVPVGESGTQKSPALELALRPIRTRQHQAMKDHAAAEARFEQEQAAYERAFAAWKRSKDSGPAPEKPERPAPARCWTDDVTIEALAGLLARNPRGLLVARDELAGWLGDFDRYAGHGGDCARWLEVFGGRPLLVDRKTSGVTYVQRACVSIAGGIQPGTLRRALGAEHRENGLLARLLLTCPPREPKEWRDADLDPKVGEALELVFDGLFNLAPETDAEGHERPRLVHLDPHAKAAWIDFYNAHAAEQADLTGDLASAWSKLEGYAARLALVIHLVRWVAGVGSGSRGDIHVMDKASIAAGAALSRWFAREAARVYAILGEDADVRDRRTLAEWIRARGGSVTARDLARGPRRFRGDAEAAEAALGDLVTAGLASWVFVDPGPNGGRPTRACRLTDHGDGDETPDFPEKDEVSVPSPVSPPHTATDDDPEVSL